MTYSLILLYLSSIDSDRAARRGATPCESLIPYGGNFPSNHNLDLFHCSRLMALKRMGIVDDYEVFSVSPDKDKCQFQFV